ncbi:hypothetical protein scyTo_0020996 [Scyliorhinus torazame]|uniref:RRM domain-containing protein n=1 Tax=Scyliorhinus torazame TaxID=75743 RepID=A0A401PT88_SCYTO|nr:hypothetical protein [Scyliorhinus torazame]
MVKIFVGNLPRGCEASELRPLFEKYGEVNECDVLSSYAFVHMEKEAEAKRAISELHRRALRASPLTVELATARLRNATKLYVGNVAAGARTRDLQRLFQVYGRVLECDIVKNYAFVHMEKERQAQEAARGLSGTELAGQRVSTLRDDRLPEPPKLGLFIAAPSTTACPVGYRRQITGTSDQHRATNLKPRTACIQMERDCKSSAVESLSEM